MRTRWPLMVLWLCFIVRGFFYSALLPMWEGYDEPFHFSFIEYVAAKRALPLPSTPVSREVQDSLHLVPLSWEERLHSLVPPIYTQDSYWKLTEVERKTLQDGLRAIPPAWGLQDGTSPALYEAQQAPLYYWVMAVPLNLARDWPLADRLFLIRILGVILTSLCLPVAFACAREIFGESAQGVGVVAVIVCMPEVMIDVSRAGNECLAIVVYSVLTLLLLKAVRQGGSSWLVLAGIVLGVGLLTKAYFVFAIPAFLMAAGVAAWRWAKDRGRILLHAAVGLVLAGSIGFAWYWRSHVATGSWSGEQDAAIAAHKSVWQLVSAMFHVNWASGVSSVLISHVWFGGWSFLKLPKAIYVIFLIGMVAAAIGLAKTFVRRRRDSAALVVLTGLYGWFWVALMCDVLVIYMARGVSASCGWYLYAVIVPEILLVACGLYALREGSWRWILLPMIAAAIALIDLYGSLALLMPYYTGLISHLPNSDIVRPATLSQIAAAGPGFLMHRLAVNRSAVLSPTALALLLAGYCLCTVLPVWISYSVLRKDKGQFQLDCAIDQAS